MLPGYAGGINWGGIAFDPENQIAVVKPLDLPAIVALIEREDLSAVYAISFDHKKRVAIRVV